LFVIMLLEKTDRARELTRGLRYHAALGFITDILNSRHDGASKAGPAS
jgi:hypothetical protein